jgi:Na+-driven multidrug efflux pump
MLMSLIDTLFISRLGPNALSAQALASVINMTFFMGLVAFIFPIANLAHLNPQKAKHYLKAGLLIVVSFRLHRTGITACCRQKFIS